MARNAYHNDKDQLTIEREERIGIRLLHVVSDCVKEGVFVSVSCLCEVRGRKITSAFP